MLVVRLLLLVAIATAAHARETPSLAMRVARLSEETFQLPGSHASAQGKEYQLSGWHDLSVTGSLALGLDYQYTRYEYNGIEGRNRDLHRLQLPLRAVYPAAGWQLDATLAPGVSTSSNVMKDLLDDMTKDDLLITARVEASQVRPNRHRWIAGFAWDRSFGAPSLYPIAGFFYAPGEKLDARIAFPESWVRFRFSDRQEAIARVMPSGHEWHVVSEELDADFDYEVEGWRAEAFWTVRLWQRLLLDIGAAWEMARHHEFLDDTGAAVDADIEDAVLFSVGLRLGNPSIPRTHIPMP